MQNILKLLLQNDLAGHPTFLLIHTE